MPSKIIDEKERVIIEQLTSLGLTPKEATVYLALFHLGLVGTSAIIKRTQLHGQYVYDALEKLEARGLIQHVIQRGRKKFSAKHPRILLQLLEAQKHTAESLVEQLQSSIIIPQSLNFEVCRGVEAYRAHEFHLLESSAPNDEVLVIGGVGEQFVSSMGTEFQRYEAQRRKKHLRVRYIGSEEQRAELQTRATQTHRSDFAFRCLPGLFTGLVNTDIWSDCITFNIFGDPVTSFVVREPEIAKSYRGFFETLWGMGK
jgi:sugar-specific transcriptional regulator TrmB